MRARIFCILSVLPLLFSCTDYVEIRDCCEVRIDVSDKLSISPESIRSRIEREYGCCIGCNLDSLDLGAIEGIVDSIPCILKGQAWITRDGVLHIQATSRDRAIRLSNGKTELFSDARGYLFPIGEYPLDDVRRISGQIPFPMRAGSFGYPESERNRRWLQGAIDVAGRGFDGEISVVDGGELRLLPRGGDEVFLFGMPEGIDEKFAKIEKYTGRIKPVGQYKTVNLKYRGQIICRKDI